ncbi:hypothetical protein DS884_02365 [Tenacibaculum sp. E3R01]|uniref:hypothetical protein n=1 Tax=unclassified Tenacibaculum TaxID=2635139 RepID=UPI00089B791D|nr:MULTISPECIES: hypothetical protein [unclassified Tenacibaculum]RBW62464.1 hypothetical protein DS884_02365 [Tenacibaculum sp. E3R01]SEE34155.1 hypothetical protein SAMN04487765_2201 [Tenacibaculum sp. MAR_2010_89]
MEKSIEKIWNDAFINEQSLIAPKINDLYNQKSKTVINKIKRTYEIDNKGLIPMAIVLAIVMSFLSEAIIGIYSSLLIVALYLFNKKLLNQFNTIDVKSDNLTYLKNYRKIISSITSSTKKLFVFAIPMAVLSIFLIAFSIKEKSFLSKFISSDTTFIEFFGIGLLIAICVSIIGIIVFTLSTKILYSSLISRLDIIIKEMEELKE